MPPILRKLTEIDDRSSGKHFEEYQYRKSDGSLHTIEIPSQDARQLNKFKNSLFSIGAVLPADRKQANALLNQTAFSMPEKRVIFAPSTGWTAKRKAFVRVKGAIGSTQSFAGVRVSHWEDARGTTSYAGTSKDWSNTVGKLAKQSTTIMTSICAAFAAPLLAMKNQSSFGICLTGKSRAGKSIAISAAASVIGIRDKNRMMSWHLTNNHLEERLPAFNDELFPIDDFEVISGSARERYLRIHNLAHVIEQGKGKGRSVHYAPSTAHSTWRTILLTSAEVQIATLAADAGLRRNDGEIIRLIDVPVATGSRHHILDRSKDAATAAARTKTFAKISKAYECCNEGINLTRLL